MEFLNRTPNFEGNMLKVLKGERPERATLFELYLSTNQIERLSQIPCPGDTPTDRLRMTVSAMAHAGYDYATCLALRMNFKITGTAIFRR